MDYSVSVEWTGEGKAFTGHSLNGVKLAIDGSNQKGTSPMILLLHGEAGCTAIDVVDMLEKMRQKVDDFRIEVDAVKTEGEYPRVWEKIHLRYILKGELDREKVQKAVDLSLTKYCSVSAMLSKTAEITHEIIIE